MNLLRPVDRFVPVNGLRFHVLDWGGEGRTPLLLLHGFTGHAHAWDTLAIALQPHFHVYALDQRGHGDSDPATVYARSPRSTTQGVVDQLGLASLRHGRPVDGRAQRDVLHGQAAGRGAEAGHRRHRPRDQQARQRSPVGTARARDLGQHRAGGPAPLRGNPYPGIHYYRWVAARACASGPTARSCGRGTRASRRGARPARSTGGRCCTRSRRRRWCCAARRARCSTATWPSGWRESCRRARFVEIPRAVHTLHEDNPDAVLAALRAFLGF